MAVALPFRRAEIVAAAMLLLIGLVVLIYGFSGGSAIMCNSPYIRVGVQCCLDLNGNEICDSSECIPGVYFAMDQSGICLNFTTSCLPRGWTKVDRCPEASCYDGIRNCHAGLCEREVDRGGPCPEDNATCFDSMMNQGELGVDCGGPCPPCLDRPRQSSCFDGAKNCHEGLCEDAVDCGGPCPPCLPTCRDNVMNQGESGVDCGGPCSPCPKPAAPVWFYVIPGDEMVNALAVSNDSGVIVVGSYDNTIYAFDREGRKVWEYDARESVEHVGISASGTMIAAGAGTYVYFFKNATLRQVSTYSRRLRTGEAVESLAVKPDGASIAAGLLYDNKTIGNNHIYYFDTNGNMTSSINTGHASGRVFVSPYGYGIVDGGILYLNGRDSPVDFGTGYPSNNIQLVVFSPSYNVVSASPVRLFFTDGAGRLKWSLPFNNTGIVGVSRRDDVIVGTDGVYKFYANGTLGWTFPTAYAVSHIDVSPSGNYVMVSTEDRYLSVLNATGSLKWKYFINSKVTSSGFSGSEEYFAAGTFDGRLFLFRTLQ
ncbi:MAG: PQQ-binding-like beta-propeller repeat protein [Candidatus Altiarchaeota archaeon]|nr:PQQ-binding-like beta-propeller repeat protein [Candidatus Altiarchaeota archaeon]